jgi:dipeptidyl aminopeptidase/acylaminoacyl peptidase
MLAAGLAVAAADKWTVDDILMQESAMGLEISRDGRIAVYAKSKMDKEQGESVSHLYLKELAGGDEVQLTRGQDSASSPRLSPSGKLIAFVTSRRPAGAPASGGGPAAQGGAEAGAGPQIWLMNTRGGEPYVLTKFERGVRSFGWLDEKTLLVAAPEAPALYDQEIKSRKDTSQVVDDEQHAPPVRLFKVELPSGKATRFSRNTDRITEVTVSPDGKWAVTSHNRSLSETYNQKIKPVYFLWDMTSGAGTQLFADGKTPLRDVQWALDSKGFYYSYAYSSHPMYLNAYVMRAGWFDLASKTASPVDLQWENGLAGRMAALPDGGFLTLLANGARNRAARYARNGASYTRTWIEGDHAAHIFSFTPTEDGKQVIYSYTNSSTPPSWQLAALNGAKLENPKAFVEFNTGFKKKTIARTELVTWKGALDETVEGILYYPHNYKEGQKHPLVVMIHGGPHGHDADAWRESWGYPHQLMAQRGVFVLKPNYHGSSNYGLKWSESIGGGKYNELEWVDVEKGVDSLIAKGLIDPARLGVLGWSNGSIITIELTTRTTRYKAAGAGAGDVNWISDWGNCAFGDSFDQYYIGKTPMDDPELYIRKSPLFRMSKVTTPTIIFFGTEDKQVPTEQGWQHFRALQHYGKAGTKFVLFPGEGHGPRKYVHQKRKLDEELAWFDKYLFATSTDTNEALKPASPLAAVLKAAKAAELPETVERGAFALSRFEVTRAQFKAFDPAYQFPAGTEHYPASGVTFEKAKAYCEWLSKKTGQTWRLPTEEEASPLLKASRTENTLDLWAGYSLNLDDANRLASVVEALPADRLLKPVGSFPGSGDDPVYDLGGNVAEWVVAKDGQGKAMGGSADRPADILETQAARPAYIGLRPVREVK